MLASNRKAIIDTAWTVIIAAGIFAINIAIVWPLFSGGYTTYMASIESAFLTDARFIAENFPYASWNPLWYMGFPFHLFYTPVLPYMVAVLHLIGDISIASAYRILIGIFYAAMPAALFLFVHYLTGRRYPAVIAALVFSLAPSFSYVVAGVRNDASSFGQGPWHLVALLKYGEGPRVSALAFTPLAALALMHAMRHPSFRHILLAALAISAVAMINWIALFGLTLILFVIAVSEMLVGRGWAKLTVAVGSIILTYGLSAFWFNLSFIQASLAFGGGGGMMNALFGNLPALIIVGLIVAPILMYLNGKQRLQPVALIGGWLVVFSVIVFGWEFARIGLVPQPNRYMPELNMAAAMAAGLIVDWGITRLREKKVRWRRLLGATMVPGIPVLTLLVSIPFLGMAHVVTRANPDITATSEYQVAQWLAAHVKDNERVYATGSHAFWLNVFTDVPQIRGGTDQGATNLWWNHVSYQINNGERGDIAVMWARALGVKYIVVSYPGSADAYRDYVYPRKFEGLLTKVYDNRGMAIFEVPLKQPGLALVTDPSAYERLTILNAVDEENLGRYLAQVEVASPIRDHRLVDNGRLQIKTRLDSPQQGVIVRVTYDSGWRAYSNGKSVAIKRDPAGFMLLYPETQGDAIIELQHGATPDIWLGYFVTAITLLFIVAYSAGWVQRFLHTVRAAWEESKGGEEVEQR